MCKKSETLNVKKLKLGQNIKTKIAKKNYKKNSKGMDF